MLLPGLGLGLVGVWSNGSGNGGVASGEPTKVSDANPAQRTDRNPQDNSVQRARKKTGRAGIRRAKEGTGVRKGVATGEVARNSGEEKNTKNKLRREKGHTAVKRSPG